MTDTAAREIIALVAAQYGLVANDLIGRDRRATVCTARQLAAWLIAEGLGLTDEQVGAILRRDRTTVAHMLGQVEELRARDGLYRALTDQVRERIAAARGHARPDAEALKRLLSSPAMRRVERAAGRSVAWLGRRMEQLVRQRLHADPAGTLRALADLIDPPAPPDAEKIGGTD